MIKQYLKLCKPKVVLLMLLTAIVGMIITPKQYHKLDIASLGLIGITLLAASGAALNHIIDQSWDVKMQRTRHRPLVIGSITQKKALFFAGSLTIIGLIVMWLFTNKTAAILTLATTFGYAIIYTCWLKHASPQNIVIGGLSGALPPILGWSCLTGTLDAEPWLLVLIIFAWTPAHFWALAIDRIEDYKKAEIPMLPVTHGVGYTKLQVLLYSILTIITTYLPFTINMFGMIYLLGVSILNIYFLIRAVQCYSNTYPAKRLFWLSIYYLMLMFAFMLIDHWYFSYV